MTTTTMAVTEKTTSLVSASRMLAFPGRRQRQWAAGERVAALFEEHGRMVYGVCRLILRDPVEAEDAAQQSFFSAYRGLLAGQEPREPSAWLGTIARNECRSRLRAQRTEPLSLVGMAARDDTQRDAGRRAEIEALCSALAELPKQQRDAIVLREFYGLSYAEVAAALGLTGAAVESLIFRSRKRLQEQLRPVRAALGALTLPLTLRDSLAQTLPGFGGTTASAGAGAAVLTKVGSAPLAAKLTAATLAVGAAGTIAGVETHVSQRQRHASLTHHPAAQVQKLASSPPSPALAVPLVKASFASATTAKPKQQELQGEHRDSGEERSGPSGGEEQHQTEARGTESRDEGDHSAPSVQEKEHRADPAEVPQPEDGHGGDLRSGNDGSGSGDSRSGSHDPGSGSVDSGSGSSDSGSGEPGD